MPKIPTVTAWIMRLKMMYENNRKFFGVQSYFALRATCCVPQNAERGTQNEKGLTLVEMIIALAMMGIVFAAIMPLFGQIRNSWDSKQAAAETLQNGRILVDHLNRTLSKAVRITAVSNSSQTNGYIEFEDNDANNLRYDVNGTTDYVEFGYVGELYDLAGPVNKLQFTCYDANDLDTALDVSTADINDIRFVKVETTLTNSRSASQNKTLFASAYLRTNGSQEGFTKGTPFEYDASLGQTPALAKINSAHYLCAYQGPPSTGWAVVLTVDTISSTITKGTPFEFDNIMAMKPTLAQIDSIHYLCAYRAGGFDGWAVVLTVDTGNWTISKETALEFDASKGMQPALAQIDSTHYLCAYRGPGDNGWAVVLTVNADWTISKETVFEYDSSNGETPALAKIDSSHFLCAYEGPGADGWAVILTVNTGDWTISKGTAFEYDTASGLTPALAQIDTSHYLCTYSGPGGAGLSIVLTVDTGTWTITKGTPLEFDMENGEEPALAQIDSTNYLCTYTGADSDGYAVVLTVDAGDWMISKGTAFEYDSSNGATPALAQVNTSNYLCAYTGPGTAGWSVVLKPGGGQLQP